LSEDAVRRRVEEARSEVERALEDVRRLAEGLGEGAFDEQSHDSAKGRLRAALEHLESLRPQQPVQSAGAQT
jgi:multidrug resistance efflux pump